MAIKQRSKSLSARGDELMNTFFQLEVLNGKQLTDAQYPSFRDTLDLSTGNTHIEVIAPQVLQINIGKLCNQTCAHCHVDAGPDKKRENMNRETLQLCLDVLDNSEIKTVDITGGAPEMNPHFRWFVEQCSSRGVKVMNRCNLTILRANKKYHDLPDFFARHSVHVISSLPYFSKKRTDSQRGDGVFEDSIEALRMLNSVGYGKGNPSLKLDLVYNPSGAFLPGDQMTLQRQFKEKLKTRYEIDFDELYAITNMPISRFLEYLLDSGNYEGYMEELVEAFNPSTIEGLMCRSTISVSWDGYMYDCDFNQMLDLKVDSDKTHIRDFDLKSLMQRQIVTDQHCYGCTAGAGSSCGGETI